MTCRGGQEAGGMQRIFRPLPSHAGARPAIFASISVFAFSGWVGFEPRFVVSQRPSEDSLIDRSKNAQDVHQKCAWMTDICGKHEIYAQSETKFVIRRPKSR